MTLVAPVSVNLQLPEGAVQGQRISFKHRELSFAVIVPALPPGEVRRLSCTVTVQQWKDAHAAELRRRREEHAHQQAVRRAERQEREVRSVLNSILFEIEAPEREVRKVLAGLISSVEASERKEAQIEREVAGVVERLLGRVVRHVDPRYGGLDTPEYARKQLGLLDAYLVNMGGVAGTLLKGWTVRVDVRRTGGTAGETDLYFFDERGKKFRSRLEVARHLGLAVPLDNRKRRLLALNAPAASTVLVPAGHDQPIFIPPVLDQPGATSNQLGPWPAIAAPSQRPSLSSSTALALPALIPPRIDEAGHWQCNPRTILTEGERRSGGIPTALVLIPPSIPAALILPPPALPAPALPPPALPAPAEPDTEKAVEVVAEDDDDEDGDDEVLVAEGIAADNLDAHVSCAVVHSTPHKARGLSTQSHNASASTHPMLREALAARDERHAHAVTADGGDGGDGGPSTNGTVAPVAVSVGVNRTTDGVSNGPSNHRWTIDGRANGRACLSAEDHPATGCADARVLKEALVLLRARFPLSADLLAKLTRPTSRIQCHAAMAVVRVPAHRLLVVREGARVVAACLVQHVPAPRRHGPEHAFSEVLLFAADKAEERRGIGHALVQYFKLCCAKAGSHRVLIMSNRNRFWHHADFGFHEGRPDDSIGVGMCRRRFDPWSCSCELLLGTLGDSAQHEGMASSSLCRIRPSTSTVAARRREPSASSRALLTGGAFCRGTSAAGGQQEARADRRPRTTPRNQPIRRQNRAPAQCVALAIAGDDDDDDVVEVGCSEWTKLPLQCVLSLQRLVDPAKGTDCRHLARCNYTELRAQCMRSKACPVMGCSARMARVHDTVRDDRLREELHQLPMDIETVWVSAMGVVRTEAPPPPGGAPTTTAAPKDPASSAVLTPGASRKRRRERGESAVEDAPANGERQQNNRRPRRIPVIVVDGGM